MNLRELKKQISNLPEEALDAEVHVVLGVNRYPVSAVGLVMGFSRSLGLFVYAESEPLKEERIEPKDIEPEITDPKGTETNE